MKTKKFLAVFLLILFVLPLFTSISFASNEPNIHSPAAILIERSTGKILYEKNAKQRMYPASTTKIMTAILALEHCDLNETATVSYDAIMTIPSGYTHASLQLDEQFTIEQLLYALLLPSANDAANVIAEHIAGSVESFATMMNTRASELRLFGYSF